MQPLLEILNCLSVLEHFVGLTAILFSLNHLIAAAISCSNHFTNKVSISLLSA